MNVDVAFLPRDLRSEQVKHRCVVVFDVLRATTTMAAALAAGVREIRVFDSLSAATEAARAFAGKRLLCGEQNCLPPPGFDLGNSPGAFRAELHRGRTVFMSTTNGTRAIVAAQAAATVLAGALVNAAAVAAELARQEREVTLLCAGTNGQFALEDLLGAGAVLSELALRRPVEESSDAARVARRLFVACRDDLRSALADAQGGRNVLAVGLGQDLDFAARLNTLAVVPRVLLDPLRLVADATAT